MPNGTYSTESRYFLVFGIKPNCLTNVSKAIRYTDLLQLKIWPKSLHMLSLEAEGTYLTLFENCRIVDPPTGIRSRADPYESNDFRWTVKARQKIEVNKRSKEFGDVQTKTVAASDLSYSEESLRALFLAALAHDLFSFDSASLFHFCLRDNLFHWFLTPFRILLSPPNIEDSNE